MDLRGKRVLVMGLGVHGGGLGVARFLVDQQAEVTITDLRTPDLLKPSLDALADLPIRYVLGEHRDEDFRRAELVIRNPGVPRDSRYLQLARAAGATVEMEMTLFFRLCPGPILGITGTKGKTTTTLLTGAMVRQEHPSTIVAGNLRISALEALPRITSTTPVVLELSSWQLEGLGEAQVSPQYVCITNISPDHLNRYHGMADYVEAKKQIFRWQGPNGVAVLNREDAEIVGWADEVPGSVIWFSARVPNKPGGTHSAVLYDTDGLWWYDVKSSAQAPEQICGLEDIDLPGWHNLVNAAAAAALAKSFGVANESIRAAVRSFPGVEHRLEPVIELNGVRYINDTTATSPAAAIAALRSFDAPIVLIAGGSDKELPFAEMARVAIERTKAIVLLSGTATTKLEQELQRALREARIEHQPVIQGPYDNFAQAIMAAQQHTQPGDVLLLSPGCASFGMFQNEFHRGEEFRRIVKGLQR